jgi:hypothetical protein
MRAWLNLRHAVSERRDAFADGLRRCGFDVRDGLTESPGDRDILVTWNRIGPGDPCARIFESRGLPVLVAENAAWGNDFAGGHWYTLARGVHNTAGRFPIGGPERWSELGVFLHPWRDFGAEIVILPQRGIGPAGVAMPRNWPEIARKATKGRIRPHPGQRPCVPLHDDLASARCAWTWGSGAAIKALVWGIPVHSDMPHWIGEQDNTDAGRLAMFERLAWAQWRLSEIASGEPFPRLLAA